MRTRTLIGASLALLIATGCQAALHPAASSSTPGARPSATAEATPTPTASPTQLDTPTATVEVTKAPVAIDVQKLVADIASGEARKEYPAVSATTLTTELAKLLKTNPNVAYLTLIKENLQTCTSNNGEHYVRVEACEEEIAMLIAFANKTGDPNATKLAKDTMGYGFRYVFLTQIELDNFATNLPLLLKKIAAGY